MKSTRIKKITAGELDTNSYLIECDERIMIIDPGSDGGEIEEELARTDKVISIIFLTHGHFDHALGAHNLQLVTGAPVAMNRKDEFLTKRLAASGSHFLRRKVTSPKALIPDLDTNGLHLKNYGFPKTQIIDIPGHTPGSVAIYYEDEKWLISGDLVFADGVGEYKYKYGSKDELFASIGKVLGLPEETTIFPGHGNEFTVAELKKNLGGYLF